ncbi:hypothetical protein [Paenibacillus glycanilyticus]|uniref:Uncharacterized protein n=1 Tax=Paenibacillus glycanilyticus TaxID=126569 RepID=A0ABQ6GKM5_9BACL|nr:hypothetical protein [Paenibacillus glycanilyticus]GLX71479.1 hypothetical protein MU1_58290 [Paenibacillus glycanilyticus]
MQDVSFELKHPTFEFYGHTFTLYIHTFENVYGLDADRCRVTRDENSMMIAADGLTWANGQEKAEGNAVIHVYKSTDGHSVRFRVQASVGSKKLRSVKLLLEGIADGEVINLRETPSKAIESSGLLLHYPEGWRNLYTPLVVMKTAEDRLVYYRSLDSSVRDKRFAFLWTSKGLTAELIFEEDAVRMQSEVVVPEWEIGECPSLEAISALHHRETEQHYGLLPWETREDVPAWAREISLVAAIHMQHWNGYIFNDYKKTGDTLEWLAERMDPKRILAYLPGWEGRYYWQYGDFRPDPRMGGEAGFEELMSRAKKLGIRVMPMFGMNVVNPGLENFEQWGAPSRAHTAGGFPITGSVDWDGSRHYDHASNVFLNPGAPGWQNRLAGQIGKLMDRYGFDGVFLDISAAWMNDPYYHYYEGFIELCRKIRENRPDCLIAGEGWYDAAGLGTPLMQSGHTDGVMHWHDEPYAPLFEQYNRSFGHLCLGAPGKGSTGVHEHGYNPDYRRAPIRKAIIPTVTIVDDTLETAADEVESIIADANSYADQFLTNTK